jgi:hypothetical protein
VDTPSTPLPQNTSLSPQTPLSPEATAHALLDDLSATPEEREIVIDELVKRYHPDTHRWWKTTYESGDLARYLANLRAGRAVVASYVRPATHQPYRDNPAADYYAPL